MPVTRQRFPVSSSAFTLEGRRASPFGLGQQFYMLALHKIGGKAFGSGSAISLLKAASKRAFGNAGVEKFLARKVVITRRHGLDRAGLPCNCRTYHEYVAAA